MDLLVNDAAIAIVFAISGWMLKTWLGHRERLTGLSMTRLGLTSSDRRLERVEQAIEAIALEMERLSEGQRYVAKLMSGRAQSIIESLPTASPRTDTPH